MKNTNPFPKSDPDRFELWEMLVRRDIDAFIQQDWNVVKDDFLEDEFVGIDAHKAENPDSWGLDYPDLEAYKKVWLEQAQSFANTSWHSDPKEALFKTVTLRDIEINGHWALLHKKFDGSIQKQDGENVILNWQTLYRCKKVNGSWKIAGFTGYLPHPMGGRPTGQQSKEFPKGAGQHTTAGPYSPVLKVNPGQFVVISGQAAINAAGEVIGETIEDQGRLTLENCAKQLESGGCSLKDVFKVNVYMKDLADWPRFNEVYKTYFSEPLPVRTAIETGLLSKLLVEIEMWAAKS